MKPYVCMYVRMDVCQLVVTSVIPPSRWTRSFRVFELLLCVVVCSMHDAVSLCRPSPPPSSDRPCTSTLPPASASRLPVADWLAGIKMERYAQQLEKAGYRSAADAARLQRQDLVALGITLAGHQKKILNGAAVITSPSSLPSSSMTTSATAAAATSGASFV